MSNTKAVTGRETGPCASTVISHVISAIRPRAYISESRKNTKEFQHFTLSLPFLLDDEFPSQRQSYEEGVKAYF